MLPDGLPVTRAQRPPCNALDLRRARRWLVLQMQHGDGISVEELADETEGFSGADLRAIVSEAQLSAVMAHLERLKAAEAASGEPDKAAAHATPHVSAAVRPLPHSHPPASGQLPLQLACDSGLVFQRAEPSVRASRL